MKSEEHTRRVRDEAVEKSEELLEVSHSARRAEPGSDWGQHSSPLLFISETNPKANHAGSAGLHAPPTDLASARQRVIHQRQPAHLAVEKLCLRVTGGRVSHDKWLSSLYVDVCGDANVFRIYGPLVGADVWLVLAGSRLADG